MNVVFEISTPGPERWKIFNRSSKNGRSSLLVSPSFSFLIFLRNYLLPSDSNFFLFVDLKHPLKICPVTIFYFRYKTERTQRTGPLYYWMSSFTNLFPNFSKFTNFFTSSRYLPPLYSLNESQVNVLIRCFTTLFPLLDTRSPVWHHRQIKSYLGILWLVFTFTDFSGTFFPLSFPHSSFSWFLPQSTCVTHLPPPI